ncbi:hypothetical protein SNEBB_008099 [Seison nebaliae]|nr:hypothetical protein SNEBB_008099 [Seison nebaliae]
MNFFHLLFLILCDITLQAQSSLPGSNFEVKLMRCSEYNYYTCDIRTTRTGDVNVDASDISEQPTIYTLPKYLKMYTFQVRDGFKMTIAGTLNGKNVSYQIGLKGKKDAPKKKTEKVALLPIRKGVKSSLHEIQVRYMIEYFEIDHCVGYCQHSEVPNDPPGSIIPFQSTYFKGFGVILFIIIPLLVLFSALALVIYYSRKKLRRSKLTLA